MARKTRSDTIDEIGKRYGSLLVVERSCKNIKRQRVVVWKCLCDCGNTVFVSGGNLRREGTKSCGCLMEPDETGNQYGDWTVLRKTNSKKGGGRVWLCRCVCGVVRNVTGSSLRFGSSKSCGHKSRMFTFEERAINEISRRFERGAINRGLDFVLTKKDVRDIIFNKCFYCGAEPCQVFVRKNRQTESQSIFYNGIDRVDNSKGYTVENCVACCGKCNRAKDVMSIHEFRKRIISIYENWAKK